MWRFARTQLQYYPNILETWPIPMGIGISSVFCKNIGVGGWDCMVAMFSHLKRCPCWYFIHYFKQDLFPLNSGKRYYFQFGHKYDPFSAIHGIALINNDTLVTLWTFLNYWSKYVYKSWSSQSMVLSSTQ